MIQKEEDTKEKLIAAAISLIREDEQNISVRKIVRRAGVGVGLVNYYFRSKENLVNIAVQRIVDEVIAKVPALVKSSNGSPEAKLKLTIAKTMEYLDSHANVSRLSILRDMNDGNSRDNTQLSVEAYDRILKEIIPDDRRRFLAGHILCSSIQSLFLRERVLSETADFDFHNEEQRRIFIDNLVSTVLSGINSSYCSRE
ncbi:MAG TPA: TetR/AcrR family transcriptional regulator [Caproicibacter sp.]|nr:TetR/AcrR family transcriptional regulator [Caproicibacter sp.]